MASASATRHALTRWLLSRGAWIVLLELTVVRVGWTFNRAFERYMLAGVLWMIGWCVWSLGLLYGITALVVIALYFPCRCFAELKAQRKQAWLSYL